MIKVLLAGVLISLAFVSSVQSQDLTSAACLVQNQTGWAECSAVCPSGQKVLNCAYSAGPLSSGDTCTSLSQVFAGPTDVDGQPGRLPHDRCSFSAVCSNGGESLSVQGWATCYSE